MKKFVTVLVFSAAILSVSARDISSLFGEMPNYILPYLSTNNRKDLVDLFQAGKTPTIENLLKGTTRLRTLKSDFLELQLNQSSSAQLKLLRLNDTTEVIILIKTVCGSACESRISSYDTKWKPLDNATLLPTLSAKDFILKPENEDAIRALNIAFISYTFNEKSSNLTASIDIKNYLSKEDLSKFEAAFKPSIEFKWEAGRFVKN